LNSNLMNKLLFLTIIGLVLIAGISASNSTAAEKKDAENA